MPALFITSNPLGDSILSSGAVSWLAEEAGGVGIVAVCSPVSAPLFKAMPEVEEVWPMRKLPRGGHWWQLWRRAVRYRWQYVLDLRGSAIAYSLRADTRKVTSRPDGRLRHRIEELSDALGSPHILAPRICWSGDDLAAAETLVGGFDRPLLFIGPTARWIGKVWPPEHYGALVRQLAGPGGELDGARVVIAGAPGEEPMAEPVMKVLSGFDVIPAIGWPLPTLAAALSKATLYIGNDTGLMHLAAAAGAPTLGLFGPSRPEHYAPWGEVTSFVRTPTPYETLAALPGFPDPLGDSLLTDITVKAVFQEALILLHKRREIAVNS